MIDRIAELAREIGELLDTKDGIGHAVVIDMFGSVLWVEEGEPQVVYLYKCAAHLLTKRDADEAEAEFKADEAEAEFKANAK